MKRYSVARARAHLAEVLDLAEEGASVIIERRGVRFAVRPLEENLERRVRRVPKLEILDPAVEQGQWSWNWTEGGLEFAPGKKSRRSRR